MIALLLSHISIMSNLAKPNVYHYLPLLLGLFFIVTGVYDLSTESVAEPYSVFE